jgi:hypothetical protein
MHFLATTHPDFPEASPYPVDSITCAAVELCPYCVMKLRSISHRTLFLMKTLRENDTLAKQVKELRDALKRNHQDPG